MDIFGVLPKVVKLLLPDKRKWCCAYCSYNLSCQPTMITDVFSHSENPLERRELMDQTKVSETSGIHSTWLKSRQITKVPWLSVLRLTSVWNLLRDWGYTQEDSIAQKPRSPPYSLCPPGSTWTSPSHLYLPWLPRSCGWLSTDTRRALCTPTSTMFSPRSEGQTHGWLMAFISVFY